MMKLINLKVTYEQQFIALVIFFSTALQLAIINVEPFWRDELFSIVIAQQSQTISQIIERAAMDSTNGPLYPLLHYHWLKLVGPYEIGLRLLSLLFASLSIPLLYFSVKNIFSPRTAKLSILIFVLGGKYVAWVIVARSFALTLLLCMAVFYLYSSFYAKSYRKISIKHEAIYIFTMLMLALSHYYGILFIIALAFSSVVCYPRRALRVLRPYILTAACFILLWGSVIFSAVESNFINQTPLKGNILSNFYDMILHPGSILLSGLFLLFLIAGSVILSIKNIYAPKSFVLVWSLFVVPFLIAYLFSIIKIPIIQRRYFVITIPIVAIIFSLGFEGFWLLIKNFLPKKLYGLAQKIYGGSIMVVVLLFFVATFKFDISQFNYRSMVAGWQSNTIFDNEETHFFDPVTSDYLNIYFARTGDTRRAKPLGHLDTTLSQAVIQQNLGTLRSSYLSQKLPDGHYKNAILTHVNLNDLNYNDSEWEVVFKSNEWIWLRRR